MSEVCIPRLGPHSTMADQDFYSNLPCLTRLLDITNPVNFVAVPPSWHIIITDIVGSTEAIAQGRYRDVNVLGVSAIAAILNLAGDTEVPFIFGGDGASILIPPQLLLPAREALIAICSIAKTQFHLKLRVGIVPVPAVIKAGYSINVAKLKVSDHYNQALISGGGLSYATALVKDYSIPDVDYLKRRKIPPKVDLTGLECRWQDIPSRYEEAVSLHILAIASTPTQANQIYKQVLEKIDEIYGSPDMFHPVIKKYLRLSFTPQNLRSEVNLRAKADSALTPILYLCKIQLENLLGYLFMRFKLVIDSVNWGVYKNYVVDSTDYQKFDDMLRMILSGTSHQNRQLINYLDSLYKDGKLVYGTHISHHVLMTCLVFERNGRQVHFIDGAGGGYTLAATALKERMRHKSLNWKTFLNMMRLRQSGEPV